MTISFTHLLKAAVTMLTLGMFAIAVAAPVTLDNGVLVEKSAYAKNGADDGTADEGHDNADDEPDTGED